MKLASLPRYIDLKKENSVWNFKHYVNHDFEMMAYEFGIGLYAILSPYELEDFCSVCDGLIIPGSFNRVNPSYYGGEAMDPPPAHDDFALDIKAIDCFVKQHKPVLGICAGHQAINIYCGGTINCITDDGTKPHYGTVHSVNIKGDSFVYEAFQTDKAEINSYHVRHIDKLGKGLEVVAASDDGIIEAIEDKERKLFGTQWHPEKCFENNNAVEKRIFRNFLATCE